MKTESRIDAGQVVQVKTTDGTALGLLKWRYSRDPRAGRQGTAYCVHVHGEDCLAAPSSILDADPTCDRCGRKKWWWTASFDIRCAHCVPPYPAWSAMWRDFDELIKRLSAKLGENADGIADLVILADKAFADDNWCEFLRIYTVAGYMTQFERQIGERGEEGTL